MIQGAMGYRDPDKALARCQWRGPKKLLYFSCFGLPKIHLHTAQVFVVNLQITVWKSLIGIIKHVSIVYTNVSPIL